MTGTASTARNELQYVTSKGGTPIASDHTVVDFDRRARGRGGRAAVSGSSSGVPLPRGEYRELPCRRSRFDPAAPTPALREFLAGRA